MLRMANRILRGTALPSHLTGLKNDPWLIGMCNADRLIASTAPVIIGDNVAEYYAKHIPDEVEIKSEFANVAPPFKKAFIEYVYPPSLMQEALSSPMVHGWAMYSCDKLNEPTEFAELSSKVTGQDELLVESLKGEARFLQIWSPWVFANGYSGHPVFHGLRIVVSVSATGGILEYGMIAMGTDPNTHEWWLRTVQIPFLVLCFMNCSNVKSSDATDTAGPSAKWQRRMKAPRLRYYILEIEPMKRALKTEGSIETNGIKKALHICRGHFRTYREDSAGLFGKHHGSFFIPSHVRGDLNSGAVVKDYSPKPGAK